MPKNKIGGKKHKGKKNDIKVAKTLEVPEENESIGQVTRVKGNGRFDVRCIDGVTRLGILRGTMRKRVWVNRLDLLLVEPWDFETDKCSILHKYDDDEVKKLNRDGEFPDNIQLDTEIDFNISDDMISFDYDEPKEDKSSSEESSEEEINLDDI